MGGGAGVIAREGDFTGAGKLRIHWQAWLPGGDPQAIVVLAHGAGEHAGRYEHVAARLVGEGHAVYAVEHRGHGRSEGSRALIDRLDHAVADLDSLVLLAAGEHPGVPVFLLGHSMGGAIAVSYALAHQDRLTGLILSAPLAALEAAPAPMRVAARVLSALSPKLPLFPIDPNLVSRDSAVVEAYAADPLNYHGKLPVRTVAELAAAIDSFPDRVPAITVPTLIMYGTADRLCPPEGSVMLGERIGSADKTLTPYEGLYHEILNEPEQAQVLDEVSAWVAAHTARTLAPSAEADSK
jgi:alpha-beta hydrolase superfamily lysophospholipase